jgi:hypothetical protein
MNFESMLLLCPPGIRIGVRLGSPLENNLDGRMSPSMSITHTWLVLSFLCFNVTIWFGTFVPMDSFCLVLQARLCHSHELH